MLIAKCYRTILKEGGWWPPQVVMNSKKNRKCRLGLTLKNLLFVCQFYQNFLDSFQHNWKIILSSVEGVASLIKLPHQFFQQICIGMQQAHTAFYQWSASTALRLSRIFSGWFTFQKKSISNTFQYKNIFIINNKIWILR